MANDADRPGPSDHPRVAGPATATGPLQPAGPQRQGAEVPRTRQQGYLLAATGWLTLALDAIARAEECAQLATDTALERYAGEAATLAQLRLYEIRVERLTLDALARDRETCPTVDPDEGASVG